ncbi:ATP-dependent DNA ligase [Xylanimonas ulmi]|uniref:Probable DNA ligase n=1 Tax=Xylanimonas ulmi TaxID=228973 RepID=A0A4V2EXL1_9MICO|nr:ATP-dependent DNA ligase [Xylanibacterium ulmi]RZS59870.1 DNA ligase-1 [Xylanibacterium ulmi]
MLLHDVVATWSAVAATRSRTAKRDLLAAALRAAAAVGAPDASDHGGAHDGGAHHGGAHHGTQADRAGELVEVVASFLSGRARQRRTGVGWRSLTRAPDPADAASLTPLDVDAALDALASTAGPGSQAARAATLDGLLSAATADEQRFLRGLLLGELRQGALDALLLDAVAAAAGVPITAVRRAAMFSALSGPIARAALTGGEAALAEFRLEVGRPVRPMLASPASDVAAALASFGATAHRGADAASRADDAPAPQSPGVAAPAGVAVEAKIDGIRVQLHRRGDDVAIFTRSLDDVTDRVPELVALARSLPADAVVLDGEAIALGDDGRPLPFQDTAARTGSQGDGAAARTPLTAYLFDALHVDGQDLLDAPESERFAVLSRVAPPSALVRRTVTADLTEAAAFFADVLAQGHEGVVVKSLTAPYDAGRRGSAWVKVKPRHTLDLVVLAVERGSGRRAGWLSNIHLGARVPDAGEDGRDGWVMLGKTFKGMSDEMLAWQTARFTELADGPADGWVVRLRPEQVVEVAFDGVQRSSRYPGGVALRFARVVRYRDDKTAAEADTLDAVRALLVGA